MALKFVFSGIRMKINLKLFPTKWQSFGLSLSLSNSCWLRVAICFFRPWCIHYVCSKYQCHWYFEPTQWMHQGLRNIQWWTLGNKPNHINLVCHGDIHIKLSQLPWVLPVVVAGSTTMVARRCQDASEILGIPLNIRLLRGEDWPQFLCTSYEIFLNGF